MLRKTLGVALVMLIVSAPAAAQDEATAAYYPLEEGTTWTYEVLGSEIIMKAEKTEKIDDQDCVLIQTLVGGRAVASEHVAVKADGIYRFAINGQKPTAPVCFLKFVKPDESWDVKSEVQGNAIEGKFTLKVEKDGYNPGNGKPAVKALTAEGKNFVIAGQQTDVIYTFAEGIGIVKLSFSIDDQTVDLVLKEHKPAEKATTPPEGGGDAEPDKDGGN